MCLTLDEWKVRCLKFEELWQEAEDELSKERDEHMHYNTEQRDLLVEAWNRIHELEHLAHIYHFHEPTDMPEED